MRREIVKFPDPILQRVAKPVKEVDGEVREILNDLVDTMYAEDGVGIAAPQIGVGKRLAAIDITGSDGDTGAGLIKMVNPEIVSRDDEIKWEEGCLSVPEMRVKIKRSRKLTVRYLDENGTSKELMAEGLLAVAIQQEIDHLDGKLIIDYASRLKQDMYIKKLKRAAKEQ
ncbi:MAG: peptide deformylase [Pseudomonadota bacterium]